MHRGRISVRHLAVACVLAGALASHAPMARADLTGASGAPAYSAAGIVNAATEQVGTLAPNAIATLYGANLAYSTYAAGAADIVNGYMPVSLQGVTVYVSGIQAGLFYVSPTQINFLIPYTIDTPTASVYVVRQGRSGPTVTIPLASASPGFFEWNGNNAVAEHADGSLISAAAPALPGEIVVLFAAGLGRTSPDISTGEVARGAISILAIAQLQLLLNGAALPASSILYAGLAPGFSGLYQINVRLPAVLPPNPFLQIALGSAVSPAAVILPAQ